MKTKVIKLSTILLLLAFVAGGCQEDEDLFEIQIGDKNAVIQKETDGVEFKFCLLNEEGKSTTVLNEGENITFYFSIKNNLQDTIIITTEFINNDFFRVYSQSDKQDMGKPWTGLWCMYNLGPEVIMLSSNAGIQLTCPWELTDTDKPVYPLCMSESKGPLAKGVYFTEFTMDLNYSLKNENRVIKNVRFKINFKIQ